MCNKYIFAERFPFRTVRHNNNNTLYMKPQNLLFFLTSAAMACTSLLTGCNNEPDIADDREYEDPIVIQDPENDIVTTTMDVKNAIFATELDDMGSLFITRLEEMGTELKEDTELVVLDEGACARFINNPEEYEKLSDFYERGGIIYFHKPALQSTGLLARLQLGVFNEVPDDTIQPLADAYICNVNGAEYISGDIYNPETVQHTYADDDGKTYTDDYTDEDKPTEYMYGRYADRAAGFVNETVASLLRSPATVVDTRAGTALEPPLIPMHWDIPRHVSISFTLSKKKEVSISCEFTQSLALKIRAAYSFDQDKDYYQLTTSQFFPGSRTWKGVDHFKHGIYKDRYAGFAFSELGIEAELYDYQPGVSIYALDGYAPANQANDGSKTTVSGWDLGGNVSFGVGSIFNLAVGGNYTSSTSITMPVKEMPVTFTQERKDFLKWCYVISNKLSCSTGRVSNGQISEIPDICKQDINTDQTWNWIVSNTQKQGDRPLRLRLFTVVDLRSCYATGGAGKNDATIYTHFLRHTEKPTLPVPERVRNQYTVVASPVNGASSYVRKLLMENSPKFKYLSENPDRCAVTGKALNDKMRTEWKQVFEEVQKLGRIEGVTSTVTFYLLDSSGNKVFMGYSSLRGIRIDTNGKISRTF